MTHYLTSLVDHPDFGRAAALLPTDICPYLFYNLTPYIFTLATGGWFNWVIRKSDPSCRRPVVPGKKFTKNINRHYPNEVLVDCPHPGLNVVVGVGPWRQNQICLRVIHNDDNCAFRHPLNKLIYLDKRTAGQAALEYNRLFPECLLRALAGTSLETAIDRFANGQAVTITTYRMVYPCRYHRQPAPTPIQLLPKNACAHVFARIYPLVLSRMYNGNTQLPITLRHPGRDGRLSITIEKSPLKKRLLQRLRHTLIDHFARIIRHPLDRLDYTLAVKILKQEIPGCSLREGNLYPVNLDSSRFLCPAAFHAAYPYLLLTAAGTVMPWETKASETMASGPDCVGAAYRIARHENSDTR